MMSALRPPVTMVFWSCKRVRASSKSGKCSRVEVGRNAPMSRVRLPPATTLQLTTFNPWNRVNYMFQPWGRPWTTMPTPPYAPPDAAMITGEHTPLYPKLLWK